CYGPPGDDFRRGMENAGRALSIDTTLSEAHEALASSIAFLDRDWPRAEAEYRRAIALDPRNPSSYYFYSIFLSSLSRPDSAVALANTARALDPSSPVLAQGPGIAY